MASVNPSTPPQPSPTLSTDQINQFVSIFFSTAVQSQATKQQSSDKDKSEQKPTRGYPNASRNYPGFDRPLYQKTPSPDYDNYRDNNM